MPMTAVTLPLAIRQYSMGLWRCVAVRARRATAVRRAAPPRDRRRVESEGSARARVPRRDRARGALLPSPKAAVPFFRSLNHTVWWEKGGGALRRLVRARSAPSPAPRRRSDRGRTRRPRPPREAAAARRYVRRPRLFSDASGGAAARGLCLDALAGAWRTAQGCHALGWTGVGEFVHRMCHWAEVPTLQPCKLCQAASSSGTEVKGNTSFSGSQRRRLGKACGKYAGLRHGGCVFTSRARAEPYNAHHAAGVSELRPGLEARASPAQWHGHRTAYVVHILGVLFNVTHSQWHRSNTQTLMYLYCLPS